LVFGIALATCAWKVGGVWCALLSIGLLVWSEQWSVQRSDEVFHGDDEDRVVDAARNHDVVKKQRPSAIHRLKLNLPTVPHSTFR
jgi:hypothetical protein